MRLLNISINFFTKQRLKILLKESHTRMIIVQLTEEATQLTDRRELT
jgi:hypothetical protein